MPDRSASIAASRGCRSTMPPTLATLARQTSPSPLVGYGRKCCQYIYQPIQVVVCFHRCCLPPHTGAPAHHPWDDRLRPHRGKVARAAHVRRGRSSELIPVARRHSRISPATYSSSPSIVPMSPAPPASPRGAGRSPRRWCHSGRGRPRASQPDRAARICRRVGYGDPDAAPSSEPRSPGRGCPRLPGQHPPPGPSRARMPLRNRPRGPMLGRTGTGRAARDTATPGNSGRPSPRGRET